MYLDIRIDQHIVAQKKTFAAMFNVDHAIISDKRRKSFFFWYKIKKLTNNKKMI